MATDLYKNERIKNLCTGTIFFNPYMTLENVMIDTVGLTAYSGYAQAHTFTYNNNIWWDGTVADWMIMAFGGQVAGFSESEEVLGTDATRLILPAGTYESTDISDMVRNYDNLHIFTPYFSYGNSNTEDAAFSYGSTMVGATTNTDTKNSVGNVKISEFKVISNNATYGHHSNVYNSKNTYEAKLTLPFKTSIEKVKQILQSSACVFMFDDRLVHGDYTAPYSIVKPLGGGSINPVVKSITVLSADVSEVVRRGAYELKVIFNG